MKRYKYDYALNETIEQDRRKNKLPELKGKNKLAKRMLRNQLREAIRKSRIARTRVRPQEKKGIVREVVRAAKGE
jgi:ribosomal protein L17